MYLFHSSTSQHFFAVFGIVHLENRENSGKLSFQLSKTNSCL